jgi:hypothetical protein
LACGAAGRRCPTSREAPFLKLTAISAGVKTRKGRALPQPPIVVIIIVDKDRDNDYDNDPFDKDRDNDCDNDLNPEP